MSKKRRFYQYTYENTGGPLFFEDMGNTLKMSGILLEGMGSQILVMSPNANVPSVLTADGKNAIVPFVFPALEEWSELMRRADDPVYFAEDETGAKKIHRRQRMAISGAIQQQIWVRDNLTCIFCLRKMGEAGVSLTVDHFLPLELGGQNDETNYITACRRCNKDKGNEDPSTYCERVGVDDKHIWRYLNLRRIQASSFETVINYWDTPDSIRKK